jgi:hypothetical protein
MMKAPKETRQWINKMRSLSGKKNGVVKWLFESKVGMKHCRRIFESVSVPKTSTETNDNKEVI